MSAVVASAASANFTAASYPVTGTATSTADEFKAFGTAVKCTENSFSGTLTESSSQLTITPTYKNCKFGTLPATVNFEGCDYLFTDVAGEADPVHVICPAGKSIVINVYASAAGHTAGTPICILKVGAQGPLSSVKYQNVENGDVKVTGTVGSIKATQERKSAVCPTGTETSSAEYVIQSAGIIVAGSGGVNVDVG